MERTWHVLTKNEQAHKIVPNDISDTSEGAQSPQSLLCTHKQYVEDGGADQSLGESCMWRCNENKL